MKDKEISEEELFKDLDTMYQRVADVEKEEAAEEPAVTTEETAAEETAVEESIETTPKKREKPQPRRRQPPRSSRRPIIIAFVGIVVVIFALAMTVFKPMVAQLIPGLGETPSVKVTPPPPQKVKPFTKPSVKPPATPPVNTPPAVPSDQTSTPVPIPKEQEAMRTPPKEQEALKPTPKEQEPMKPAMKEVEKPKPLPQEQEALKPTLKEQEPVKPAMKEVEKAKPLLQETAELEKTFTLPKFYAIQVGAFHNLEYARDLVESLKKDGLDAYWLKKGKLYKVFVGQFPNKSEAAQFLKEQKIFNNYPESYPQKVSSPKASSPKIDPQ